MSNPALFVEGLDALQRKSSLSTHEPPVSIIMRSYNEGWALRNTLPALLAQDYKNWELIAIDSGSTDGSVELIRQAKPAHFVQIRHEDYNPSRVMNRGMELARSEFCIFLNADATPQGVGWLRPLAAGLLDPQVAAVFGRQIPRPDCQAVYAHDYERCFGSARESTQWDHFFSMVSSGLRKDIWRQRGFLEKMQYSEDDEYTRWCREQGYRIVYLPDSIVMHSHNYTPQQAYKRSFGEAKALAAVWNGAPDEINFTKTVVLGWANDARRDLLFCSRRKRLHEWPHAARIRWHQRHAKLAGFREGWKFYRNGNNPDLRSSRREEAPNPSDSPRWIKSVGSQAPETAIKFPPLPGGLSLLGKQRKESGRRRRPERAERVGASESLGWGEGKRRHSPDNQQISENNNRASSRRLLRFTIDGSDALENHLALRCEKVLTQVQSLIPRRKLEALVLGGGYGRGQGGVLKTKSGDAPYNDLEFYVFLRGNRILNERKFHQSLQSLGERLSPEAGLHVEFKVDSLRRLRRSPVTMFSYDLISGHRTLFGGENIFAGCGRHRDASQIPLAEAARLLFNRCTGLLLAKELLQKRELTTDDADFIGRNLAKAQLALGDAVLVAAGKYHWDCLQRRRALEQLTSGEEPLWAQEVQRHHAAGVDFKLHPQRISKSPREFQAEHETISRLAQRVWLWLESRRLNQRFSSAHDYAFSLVEKCAGTPPWRNVLLNVKTFGPHIILDKMAERYPRERLLNSLPLLLWDEPLNDLRVKRHLQKELRTTASDWQGFVAAYRAVWPKFS